MRLVDGKGGGGNHISKRLRGGGMGTRDRGGVAAVDLGTLGGGV